LPNRALEAAWWHAGARCRLSAPGWDRVVVGAGVAGSGLPARGRWSGAGRVVGDGSGPVRGRSDPGGLRAD